MLSCPSCPPSLSHPVDPPPFLSLQVKVKSSSVIQSPKLTVSVQPPLAVTQEQFVLENMGQCVTAAQL